MLKNLVKLREEKISGKSTSEVGFFLGFTNFLISGHISISLIIQLQFYAFFSNPRKCIFFSFKNWDLTEAPQEKPKVPHYNFLIFQAMARDPKNIWQETPKQIRQKVLKFITIPEQFAVYAKERGLLE